MNSPEPILDMVRMISVITSANIGWKQTVKLYKGLFSEPCPRCRGTGKVICRYCRGSKVRMHKQPYYSLQFKRWIEPPANREQCTFCGDLSSFDDDFEGNKARKDYGMDENGIIRNTTVIKKLERITEKLKAAYRNVDCWDMRDPPTAGTVTCPTCNFSGIVWRHTPNLPRFLGLDAPWDVKISRAAGYHQPVVTKNSNSNWAASNFYLEYPTARVQVPEERDQVSVIRELYEHDLAEERDLKAKNEKAIEDVKKMYLQDGDDKYFFNYIDVGEEEVNED